MNLPARADFFGDARSPRIERVERFLDGLPVSTAALRPERVASFPSGLDGRGEIGVDHSFPIGVAMFMETRNMIDPALKCQPRQFGAERTPWEHK